MESLLAVLLFTSVFMPVYLLFLRFFPIFFLSTLTGRNNKTDRGVARYPINGGVLNFVLDFSY